ncbi:protein cramped-like [Asterias amurensis]|uniref:protein cramped-like n=1 Tax=Asterias amurensis TaxID=7602 RepID=UPI003AB10AB8
MVKRKKEVKGDEAPICATKKGDVVTPGTTEEANLSLKGCDSQDQSVMKGPETNLGGAPENGSSQTVDSQPADMAEEGKVAPIRPQQNHPFLRSSVKRKKKEPTPPPPPPKPEEAEKVEAKPDRKRCWEAWSDGETTLFFEAVNEYGKDFDAIQKYIEQRHKKLGLAAHQVKNKNQVRHLYYRTCHKLFSYIDPKPDQEKTVTELYALVNYGELRKKLNLKGGITRRVGQRFNQLITTGQTVIRVKGMNRRVKTPLCKALRKINGDENKSDPYKLPAHVLMELQPKNNKAWASVQSAAHNPRVRLVVSLKKNLGSIISYLNDKWTPHRSKLLNTLKPSPNKGDILHLGLVLTEGVEVTPHNQITGRYMHSDSRAVFSLDSEMRVIKAVAASKAAKIQRTASSGRTPSGSSLDCTRDVPGLDKKSADGTTGKPTRKYKPRKRAKLSKVDEGSNGVAGPETLPEANTVSNQSRKTEDSEHMDLGKSDSSKSPLNLEGNEEKMELGDAAAENEEETIPLEEIKWTVAPEKEITKDEQLKGVLSSENSTNLTMTDIYLMLKMPTRLKFEYEFVRGEIDTDEEKKPESNLLHRLYELASTEFTNINKATRSVSVGTVTSPQRFSTLPGTNTTPPSKSSFISNLSKSPSNARGQRNANNGFVKANSRVNAKGAGAGKDKDSGVFLTPAAPSPHPQRLAAAASAESSTTAAEKLFMAQIESLHKQPTFLQSNNRRGRKPLVVQRTLLPRPQSEHTGPTRHMMSMSKTGQFTPVQLGIPEGVGQRPIIRPVPVAPASAENTPVSSPSSNEDLSSSLVSYSLPLVSSSVDSCLRVSSPISSLAMSSPSPMNEIEAASAAAGIDTTLCPSPDHTQSQPSPIPMGTSSPDPIKSTMLNPSPQIIDDTMEIVSVLPSSNLIASAQAHVGLENEQPFRISPPNLSSLLEISLPSSAAAGGADALLDIPIGPESFTGFNQQLPPLSPVRESGNSTPPLTSPFKLSLDSQWLNGEGPDVSLSSILAHLESPEKKERQNIINSVSLSIPPVNMLNDSSRDSTMSRDVDTHLQCMMNENSVDYVAKFADLAAQITAQEQKEAALSH